MAEWSISVKRVLKLALWLQFLRAGMYRLFLRYYGLIWLVSAVLVALPLVMLVRLDAGSGSPLGSAWVVAGACPFLVVLAYGMTRSVGILPVAMLAACLCGTFVIKPTLVAKHSTPLIAEPEEGSSVGTGDLQLFVRGAAASAGLSAFSYLLLLTSRLPGARSHGRGRRWPLRSAMLMVLVVTGLVGLEAVRVASGAWNEANLPWQRALAAFLREPGWAAAMSVWLWINVGSLLAHYDRRLIPYLLRRTGHAWVASDISAAEFYMVDELLHDLGRPSDPAPRESQKHPPSRRSKHR